MPLTSSVSNQEFPYYALKLIAASRFEESSVGAQVVIVLEPYNIVDGKIVRPTKVIEVEGTPVVVVDDSKTISDVFGNVYVESQANPNLAKAMGAVLAAAQAYINATGR